MDTHFLHASAPQRSVPSNSKSLPVLGSTAGVSALIVPNDAMSLEGIQSLRVEFPHHRLLVLDNNPFNHETHVTMSRFLELNREWLRVIDHHGAFNDGVSSATLPRLLEKLHSLSDEGFLGERTLLITNAQNLDPDGVLSFYAAARPKVALALKELLTNTANYTDFTIFCGERFDSTFSVNKILHEPHKVLGLALLQLITNEKERFVERVTAEPISVLGADVVRKVFVSSEPGQKAPFDHSAVLHIYSGIINERLDDLLRGFLEGKGAQEGVLSLAEKAAVRLKIIYSKAKGVSEVVGQSSAHPDGKFVLMTPKSGFTQRLDSSFPVHDWLLASAAQYCFDAPVHVRRYREMLVISVRHLRIGESSRYDYDVSPLIERLNRELSALKEPRSIYGRKEVVLGVVNPLKLSDQRIQEIVEEEWGSIEKAKKGDVNVL